MSTSELIAQQILNGNINKRTWGDILYNIKTYGAVGDGVTDDTTKIATAVTAAAIAGGVVAFPPGTYVTGTLNIPSNVTLMFSNGAKLSVTSGSSVTINGPIDAGLYQIFSGSGNVSLYNSVGSFKTTSVYPEWFGAMGDNSTNDTSSINKAIAAIPNYGGTLYLTDKYYKVDTVVVESKLDLTITGRGRLSSISGNSANSILSITNSDYCKVEGIKITGFGSGTNDRGIWVVNCKGLVIDGVQVTNCSDGGLYLWGTNDGAYLPILITNCKIFSNYYGIYAESNASYIDIMDCIITQNTYGVYGGFSNINIRNNQISQNVYGIYSDGNLASNADHNSISGNKINHNEAVGLYIANNTSGIQIVDNQILSTVGPSSWPTTGSSHSLVIINATNLQLIGNLIDGGSAAYVYLSGLTDSRFIGNRSICNLTEQAASTNLTLIGNDWNNFRYNKHANTTSIIKMGNIEAGVLNGDLTAVVNKTAVSVFTNSWVNYGSSYEPLCYWKDAEGCIHVQGVVKSGTVNTAIFTLPTGFRPTNNIILSCTANLTGDVAAVLIYPSGAVQQLSGGNTLLSLNFTFKP